VTDLHNTYIFNFLIETYSADYILGRGVSYLFALKLRPLHFLFFSSGIDPDGEQADVRRLVSMTSLVSTAPVH
jgi:hypothetical protein